MRQSPHAQRSPGPAPPPAAHGAQPHLLREHNVDVGGQADDVARCLLEALGPQEEAAAKHRGQRQVAP